MIGLLLVVGVYATFLDLRSDQPLGSDFAGFHHSARSALSGGELYAPMQLPDAPTGDFSRGGLRGTFPNLNPPVFTLFVLPLGLLPLGVAFVLWTAAALLCGGGAVLQVTRGEPGSTRFRHALLLFAWYPVVLAVTVGQTTLFLLLGLAIAGTWWDAGRTRGAAIVLGLLASLKLFFGLFGVVFLLARRYRTLGWMVVAFVASWTLGLVAFGADAYARYAETLASVDWHGVGGNVSLAGTAERLFGGSGPAGGATGPGSGAEPVRSVKSLALLAGGAGILLLGLFRVARSWGGAGPTAGRPDATMGKARRSRDALRGCAFGYTVAAMLLLSPLGWVYYFPLLYPGFVHLWRGSGQSARALLTVAALTMAVPSVYLVPSSLEGAGAVRGVIGTAALATAAAVAWWRGTRAPRPARR